MSPMSGIPEKEKEIDTLFRENVKQFHALIATEGHNKYQINRKSAFNKEGWQNNRDMQDI
jgi:hypothetical protein